MADFHVSVKTISRSAGRSATAAAAYRSAVLIVDQRTGEIHDYERKRGVRHSEIFLPENAPVWMTDRSKLWNAVEQRETRKNSTVAREFEIALPLELNARQRIELARAIAREITARHKCAVDISVHKPTPDSDGRNHHVHILCSTRRVTPEGFGEKTRELDERTSGEINYWRERIATIQNEHLARAGHDARVDHRSLEAQGIDREPTRHLGPAATGFERRTGEASNKRLRHELAVTADSRLATAYALGEIEREQQTLNSSIFDLSCDLDTARADVQVERGNATALLQSSATRFADRLAAQREQTARNAAELQRQATAQRTTQEAAKSLLQRCSQHAVECSLNKFKMNPEMTFGHFEIEAILHRATKTEDKRELEKWFNKQSFSDNPIDVVLGLAGRAANINKNSEFHTDLIKMLNDAGIHATPERIALDASKSAEEAALKNRERNNDVDNDNGMGM